MKTISRRTFLEQSAIAVGVGATGALAASCTPAAPVENKSAAAVAEKITLRYTHWGNEDEKASTGALLKKFEQLNPGITVEQIHIPEAGDPFLQKLTAMAASNTLPDASLFPDNNALDWALKDMFLDISGEFVGDHEKLEAIQYRLPNGQMFSASVANEIMLLWYNKDVFDTDKQPYLPIKGADSMQWDDFIKLAKFLTVDIKGNRGDSANFDPDNIDRFGFQMGLWFMPVNTIVRSAGGDWTTRDYKKLTLDSPETIAGLQLVSDLMNVHHVMPKLTSGGGISDVSTDNGLLSKKIAMKMDGQWVLETLAKVKKESKLNFGIGVLPFVKEKVTTSIGGPICAFKASKHPAEAARLAAFVMDPEQAIKVIQGGLWMPNEKRWYTDPALLSQWIDNDAHPEEYKSAVVDYALGHVTHPLWAFRAPGFNGFDQILSPALQDVWQGKKTAAEAVAEIMPVVQAYFDKEVTPLMG